jgi:hypothetical protein
MLSILRDRAVSETVVFDTTWIRANLGTMPNPGDTNDSRTPAQPTNETLDQTRGHRDAAAAQTTHHTSVELYLHPDGPIAGGRARALLRPR